MERRGRGTIIRGRRLIEGWLLFDEIRYSLFQRLTPCHLLRFGYKVGIDFGDFHYVKAKIF